MENICKTHIEDYEERYGKLHLNSCGISSIGLVYFIIYANRLFDQIIQKFNNINNNHDQLKKELSLLNEKYILLEKNKNEHLQSYIQKDDIKATSSIKKQGKCKICKRFLSKNNICKVHQNIKQEE